jgi:hypothetical protein
MNAEPALEGMMLLNPELEVLAFPLVLELAFAEDKGA